MVDPNASCNQIPQEPVKYDMVSTIHKDTRKRNYKRIKTSKNLNIDDFTIVHRVDPHILPLPPDSETIRASDFKHCEISDGLPFKWVKYGEPIEECFPPLHIRPETPPSPMEMVASADQVDGSTVLRFPRSYLSFFRNIPEFPVSAASKYCLDKFSELQGYLSVNPPFDVEIFHNANIRDCCVRPPPSVNDCIRNKRCEDLRNHLESLPKENYQNKVNKWLGGSGTEPQGDITHIMKEETCPSLYYQSDFANSHFLQINDIPHLNSEEFVKSLCIFFFQIWLSYALGGLPSLLLSTFTFFCFLGQKTPVFSFQLLACLGSFLDLFFETAEYLLVLCCSAIRHQFHVLRFRFWFNRFKSRFLLRFYRFLTRFSSIFLPEKLFKPGFLFHRNLRHLQVYANNHLRSSSRRRYIARRLTRGKSALLQLYHLKHKNISPSLVTVPLYIDRNVPTVHTAMGEINFSSIIDSGSPCNLCPYSMLKNFEESTGFQCVRFENSMSLQAHSSQTLRLKDFGAIIPITFTDCAGNDAVLHLPFLLEECQGQDVIIGLPQIKCLDLEMHTNKSTCTLTFKDIYPAVKPISPIPVYFKNDNMSVPKEINVKNGLYHFSTFHNQSFHDDTCTVNHDPRTICNSSNSSVYKYVPPPIPPNICHKSIDEPIFVRSNRCADLCKHMDTMLPGLVGVLERVSTNNSKQDDPRSWPDRSSNPRISNPRVSNVCSARPSELELNVDDPLSLNYVEIEQSDPSDPISHSLSDSSISPNLNVNVVNYLPEVPGLSKILFVSEGPEFSCLFSNGYSCSCTPLKLTKNIKFGSFNSKTPQIFVAKGKDAIKTIYFSLPDHVRICDTQKIALLIKLLLKFETFNILWDITGHGSHPSLQSFLEHLRLGFNRVHVESPVDFNLFLLDKGPGDPVSPPPPPPNVNHICIQKNSGMRGNDSIIPESILNEAEAFPFLPVLTLKDDIDTFLSNSGGEEKEFLQDLLKTFSSVPSSHPGDIGKIDHPDFLMDIILKDPNHPLPLDMPYPSSVNKKLACAKIVQHWMDAGIVVPSNVRTHASRLTVAHKHLNKSDFNKIITRLKKDHNLDYSHLEISEFHRISPTLLNAYEISKSYRVCLDARNLNSLTADEIVCSPNPDSLLSELMFMKSDQSNIEINADLISNAPAELLSYLDYLPEDLKDNKMYYSSLDIRSAHTSLVLTERASSYLNVILPDYQIIRFIQAPFGLKTINSRWNTFITTILKDLIERKLVVIYADDILVITHGRKLHRLVLIEIFRRFAIYNVKISLNKCYSFVSEFQFLGFTFNEHGIKLTQERISGILNIEPPSNLQGVQRLLGTLNYISRFLPDLQEILLPITKLLNKTEPFIWGESQEHSLNKIKTLVQENSSLSFIDADVELSLYCDSSKKAGGAVLFQWNKKTQNQPTPVCFFSRKYNAEQTRHLSALELELINLIDSLSRLKCFINISSKPVLLHTDAKSVLFLLKSLKEGANPKLARLGSRLAQFDLNFKIIYTKPTSDRRFLIADFLSRSRDSEDSGNLPPPPMKAFRKLDGDNIRHTIPSGTILSFSEMISKVEDNPTWFINFPTPLNPWPQDCDDPFQPDNLEEPLPVSLPALTDETPPRKMHNLLFLRRDLSPTELIDQQLKDSFIRPIVDKLNENPGMLKDHKGYFLKNNVLHKTIDDTKDCSPTNSLLVLPSSLVPNIVAEFHIAYGHLGRDKLISLLSSMYHSTVLNKTCISIINGCHICQLIKPSNSRLPPLVPSQTAQFPMNVFALDFFTVPPFRGFKTVLIGIDHFSGFIVTRACRSESASEVTSFLSDVFSKFGAPITIKSDNGTSLLRARPVRSLLALWGVEVATLSLAYTPVHNGKVERSIRAFRSLVRSLSPDNVRGWYPNLQRLTFINNMTPRVFKTKESTVLASPFELFLRRRPTPLFINPSLVHDPTSDHHFQKSKDEIEKLDDFVSKFLAQKNKEYISKMNINTRPSLLKIGDLCILKDNVPPQAGDLPKKYFPPFKNIIYIVRLVKDLLCVLEDPLTGNIIYQNVRYVKKYKTRDDVFKELSPELQKVVGYPFNPLSFSSRKELIEFLAKDRLDSVSEQDNQSIHSLDDGDSSQVSILPKHIADSIVPGPQLTLQESILNPSPSISQTTNSVPSVSNPEKNMFMTPLLDEFYPESKSNENEEHAQVPPVNSDVHPDDDTTASSNTRQPGSSGVSPNPWRRITRAAAKLRKK